MTNWPQRNRIQWYISAGFLAAAVLNAALYADYGYAAMLALIGALSAYVALKEPNEIL